MKGLEPSTFCMASGSPVGPICLEGRISKGKRPLLAAFPLLPKLPRFTVDSLGFGHRSTLAPKRRSPVVAMTTAALVAVMVAFGDRCRPRRTSLRPARVRPVRCFSRAGTALQRAGTHAPSSPGLARAGRGAGGDVRRSSAWALRDFVSGVDSEPSGSACFAPLLLPRLATYPDGGRTASPSLAAVPGAGVRVPAPGTLFGLRVLQVRLEDVAEGLEIAEQVRVRTVQAGEAL
jgi:hypothetical protein